MSSDTLDAPSHKNATNTEDTFNNVESKQKAKTISDTEADLRNQENGKLEQLQTVSQLPSHKFQSRIGRLDADLKWVSEINWQATKKRPSPKQRELSEFVLKIDDDYDPERMIILSPYVRKVFIEVVKFYPGVDFTLESTEMTFPYSPLYHYFQGMRDFVRDDKGDDRNLDDFEVLEWYHDNHLKGLYNDVENFIGLSNVSFEYLWAIFRPGDLVMTRDRLGQPQLHILTTAEIRKRVDEYDETTTTPELVVKAWSMIWSSSTRTLRRSLWSFIIPQFSGSRGVTSLEVYPFRFESNSTQKSILDGLTKRGKLWRKLVSERPTCWHYKGAAFDGDIGRRMPREAQPQTINIDERVIVEQSGNTLLENIIDAAASIGNRDAASEDSRSEFRSYDDLDPTAKLTPFQASLCPAVIGCFCLETQKLRTILVHGLTEVKWNKAAWSHLVLKQQTKKLLSGLVQQHTQNLKGTSDFISNKGKGLTFVLYGPSGVGKTFTAESLAEHNELPIRPINMSHLIASGGGGPEGSAISQIFSQAKRWDAILLIDEADVVLEKRALEDVRRNAMVSAFLRELEYFTGILFLTTNRIETMDRAFQSRIQIAVEYKPLGVNSRRQIWEGFIETLRSEDEREELEPHVDVWKTHPLNGRQIRNVMNLARSLALNDVSSSRTLGSEHIEQAIEETLRFQELFNAWENEPKRVVNRFLPRRKLQNIEGDNEDDD